MAISFASLASGKTQKTEIITSTQSWTAPTGVTKVEVILCGGGGAGGGTVNASGYCSGGAGSVDYKILTVTPGTAYTITIGAGGSNSNGGNSGGTSSFGTLFYVSGGDPGFNLWNGSWVGASIGTRMGGGGGHCYNTQNGWVGAPGMPGAFGFGGGGGGGGANYSGAPGSSGGGAGATDWPGGAWANTGSGGGGVGTGSGTTKNGGSGGSGVCVIKYWS